MEETYAGLQRLSETRDFAVAQDDPDIRGWDVVSDTRQVGEVADLIVDPDAMKVRYVEVISIAAPSTSTSTGAWSCRSTASTSRHRRNRCASPGWRSPTFRHCRDIRSTARPAGRHPLRQQQASHPKMRPGYQERSRFRPAMPP